MRPLRILIANWTRAAGGGAETYARCIIPALQARGHEVGLLCEQDSTAGAPTIDGAASGVSLFRGEGPVADTIRRVEDWRPDIVFVQSLLSPELESALSSRFATALFAHGYYGTCATGTKCHSFPAARPCRRPFGPACIPLNFVLGCGTRRPVAFARTCRVQRARRRLLIRYGAICVASRHMRDEFLRHGVSAQRLHVVPLPSTDVVADRRPPEPRAPSGRIVALGRLSTEKGGDRLISAMPLARRALGTPLRLVMAGSGPRREDWGRLAEALGEPVEFPGWVEGAERERLLREADLLAMPSLWPEPFGLSGIEAGARGVPAVAYALGGIPEWLEQGVNGELAPADPPTVRGLTDAIVRALRSPAHWQELRVGAWRRARGATVAAHVEALEPTLLAVAAGDRSRDAGGTR